ncbi:MAG: hypothetical protein HC831_13545 [Chloroflexia bacterium]|nr:hypothetical protein [Chloroflexia bacterium]
MEIDLSKLIEGKLHSVKIDTFKIDNGKLNFYYQSWLRFPTYKANHFNLGLFNFDLSENSGNSLSKIFYSDSIQLKLDTFSANLPDNTHSLSAKSIHIFSGRKMMEAAGLLLRPLTKKKDKNSLDISIPMLKISGTDFNRLYHDRILNIAGLYLSPSNFKLKLWQKKQLENDSTDKKNPLSQLTTNFVRQLYIRNLDLRKSRF